MHNILAVLLLATATQPKVSVSLAAPVDQAALAQKHDQIASKLTPSAKLKLQAIAGQMKNMTSITDGTSRDAIMSAFPGANLGDSDISALTFIVMMDASKAAQEDLQSIMAAVKDINKQKDALRQELGKMHQLAANNTPHVQKVMHVASLNFYSAPAPLPATASLSDKKKRLDDLEDMSQQDAFALQQMMDKKSQLETMLSNVAKKVQDANAGIISKLK